MFIEKVIRHCNLFCCVHKNNPPFSAVRGPNLSSFRPGLEQVELGQTYQAIFRSSKCRLDNLIQIENQIFFTITPSEIVFLHSGPSRKISWACH